MEPNTPTGDNNRSAPAPGHHHGHSLNGNNTQASPPSDAPAPVEKDSGQYGAGSARGEEPAVGADDEKKNGVVEDVNLDASTINDNDVDNRGFHEPSVIRTAGNTNNNEDEEESSGNDNNDNSHHNPPPPPNGGYGWVCTACVATINAHTWGLNSSYGVFLAHYLATNTFPGATPSTTPSSAPSASAARCCARPSPPSARASSAPSPPCWRASSWRRRR
ncbi:hypothetical protein ACCO45_006645 [Purpureocillium lilacinum]|uniref:Uncharacterized protein n=1 Tax=Purpureocillium lilacinum TaxID=33203 RepID=A0ACC4DQU0_PURLI